MNTTGFRFEVIATRGHARAGLLHTPRGVIETPAFMPVGTAGTVKAMTMPEMAQPPIDARIILGNTYHLYLRPGLDVMRELGGLHAFSGWQRPILTDSGGFQVFSLAAINKADDDGVTFRSHIDGSAHRLTPEVSMQIQGVLGSDIAMVFDQCPPGDADEALHALAVRRSVAWAARCAAVARPAGQALFGIVQGGIDAGRRRAHLEQLLRIGFDGYALGGLSVGEPIPAMYKLLDEFAHELPAERPRYLMGVGTPNDLTAGVLAGIDMFDCVMPTRNARNGFLFTSAGKLVISNAIHTRDPRPIDENCDCPTCQTTSRAYLRHLYRAKEITYSRLATMHNLAFYAAHMRKLREEILSSQT